MAVQTHKRPDLQPAVAKLLETATIAIRDGGQVPLAQVVAAAAGSALKPAALRKLEQRGVVLFEPEGETTRFLNIGPRMSVRLERFSLTIPTRISGRARLHDGGIELDFDAAETLSATKFFLSVRLERIAVNERQIVVGAAGGAFDQRIDLV